jgi:hypothetical protein
MSDSVVHLSDKEFADFLQTKEVELQVREKELRKGWRRLLTLGIVIPIAIVFFGHHQIQALVSPTYLEPDQVDTRVLDFHKRHLFSDDSVERLEVHHSDWGTDEWMKKLDNGEWVQAFSWKE